MCVCAFKLISKPVQSYSINDGHLLNGTAPLFYSINAVKGTETNSSYISANSPVWHLSQNNVLNSFYFSHVGDKLLCNFAAESAGMIVAVHVNLLLRKHMNKLFQFLFKRITQLETCRRNMVWSIINPRLWYPIIWDPM